MAKRIDYQNPNDNLDEITDKRNAEIRAWGKQILADADALAGYKAQSVGDISQYDHQVSDFVPDDWYQIVEPDLEVVSEEVQTVSEPTLNVIEEPQGTQTITAESVVTTPKVVRTPKNPKTEKPATS